MESLFTGPVREKPPRMGCTREMEQPGCHDRRMEFKKWRQKIAAVNEKRREYKDKPFSRIS